MKQLLCVRIRNLECRCAGTKTEGQEFNVVSLAEVLKRSYHVAYADTYIMNNLGCGQWRGQPAVPSKPAAAN